MANKPNLDDFKLEDLREEFKPVGKVLVRVMQSLVFRTKTYDDSNVEQFANLYLAATLSSACKELQKLETSIHETTLLAIEKDLNELMNDGN